MSEPITKTRTNYFRCKDPGALQSLIKGLGTDGHPAVLIERDGLCMFYCEGEILGAMTEEAAKRMLTDPGWLENNPEKAWCFDLFLKKLQALVPDNEAVIVKSVGYEKMRDLWADGWIVTCDKIQKTGLDAALLHTARNLLNDPGYTTQISY